MDMCWMPETGAGWRLAFQAVSGSHAGTAIRPSGRPHASHANVEQLGANTNAFHEWKWTVKGKQVIGEGPVSPGAGRRLLSVLDPPSITHAISASQEVKSEDKAGTTSLKYFKSVRILLDDLQEE